MRKVKKGVRRETLGLYTQAVAEDGGKNFEDVTVTSLWVQVSRREIRLDQSLIKIGQGRLSAAAQAAETKSVAGIQKRLCRQPDRTE